MEHKKFFGQLTIISVFISIILGVIFLVIRCFVIKNAMGWSSSSSGQPYACDVVAVLAVIASCGIILYAILVFVWWIHRAEKLKTMDNAYHFALVFFLMTAGIFSLWSTLRIS